MEIRQLLRAIFILILTATIVGCGGGGGGTPETPPDSTANSAPTANAGPDQNVTTGTLASLNGSSSSDADGDSLTYLWSTTSKPNGSASSLSNTTAANPQFSADVDGQYTFQLVVNDGELNSSPDSITVTSSTANSAPTANAGPDQNVTTGTLASLNGSSSSDADGDSLTYLWSTTSKPNGSASSLSNTTAANPQFSADVDGQYTFQLVVNDGELNSSPDSVTVTSSTANSAPTANAGPDQNVTTGFLATLDGSASSDADGDPLSYSWTITSKPSGSASTISFSTDVDPFFAPDRDGQYVFQLIVNDGQANSAPDSITVTSSGGNSPPTANAGADQTVLVGDVAQLDNSNSSDADGDTLSYSWSFVSKPNGSVSALSDATQASPTFLTDQAGSYVLSLVVNDGTENSNPDSVTITASTPKVRLYTKGNGIFDPTENEVGLPYSSQGTNNSSIIGSDVITLGEFRLEALGTDFNVTSLQAIDRNGIVAPRFVGLVNGDTVSAGSSISFKLETPKTNNQQADLLFSFTIQETGETFSFQRLVTTN